MALNSSNNSNLEQLALKGLSSMNHTVVMKVVVVAVDMKNV